MIRLREKKRTARRLLLHDYTVERSISHFVDLILPHPRGFFQNRCNRHSPWFFPQNLGALGGHCPEAMNDKMDECGAVSGVSFLYEEWFSKVLYGSFHGHFHRVLNPDSRSQKELLFLDG